MFTWGSRLTVFAMRGRVELGREKVVKIWKGLLSMNPRGSRKT